ncbi:MAG: hypothetical protein ACOX8W_06745 [bacterium]
MLNEEEILKAKDNPAALAAGISDADIPQLVAWLAKKNDALRYVAFLLLQALSETDDRVYRHWDVFAAKLDDANSYQRSLGLMLLAANVRWDKAGRFAAVCDAYLAHCADDKFITARQCIQGLNRIIDRTEQYNTRIIAALTGLDLAERKESQRKLLLMDSLQVLGQLYRKNKDARIRAYLEKMSALAEGRVRETIAKIMA